LNKKNSTKQQPSASAKRIPRLFETLIAVGLIKLLLLSCYGVNQWIAPHKEVLPRIQATRVVEAQAAQAPGTSQPEAPTASSGSGNPGTTANPTSDEQEDLGDVLPKWSELKEKQQALNRREEELRRLEKTLDAKLREVKELQENIRKMLDEANVLKDKKIKHLIDVYSNMKAKQAALVLESLEEDIAVKILSGMRGRKAGEILSYVTPKKAALLSERLTDLRIPFAQ
jgi:flagellar motility protein MotE (MotC chaperone)